ncbi:MAG: membrane protein insertion efficiency factor YidD [Desulfobacterales bacterium]|nr:membrane protein insertion efficiency factor YidD [Desulfobacterales bacterium]
MPTSFLRPRTYILALIRLYQLAVSPLLPGSCRFVPTCSAYASLAISKYGILKGSALALIRILKCHPLHPGGHDPLT